MSSREHLLSVSSPPPLCGTMMLLPTGWGAELVPGGSQVAAAGGNAGVGTGRGVSGIFIVVVLMMVMTVMTMERGTPSTGRGASLLSAFRSGSWHWLRRLAF